MLGFLMPSGRAGPCYTVRANAAERSVARSASKPAGIECVLPPGGKESALPANADARAGMPPAGVLLI